MPKPKKGEKPYAKRPRLWQKVEDNPNSHYLTREPRRIGIVGAGAAGCIYLKTLA
jgi:hypothetical protein